MPTRRASSATTATAEDVPVKGADGEWRMPVSAQNALAALAESELEDEDAAELAIGERVRLLLAQTGGERVSIKLYRIDPKSRSMPWCCDYTPEEFQNGDLEMIRQQWGPGEYEARVIGSRGIIAKPRFTIASPYALVNHNPIQQQAAQQPAASSELSQALQMMAQTQAMILQTLQGMQQAPQGSGMADALGLLRTARDILQPASSAPPVDPLASFTQIAAAMRTMRDLSQEINPPAATDPDNPLSLAGPIIDMIKTAMQQRQGVPQQFPAIAPPPSLSENPVQDSHHDQQQETAQMILNGAVSQLVKMATANDDPKNGGVFIYNGLPSDLIPYLSYPNWFEILSSVAPALTPHRAWIEQAKAHADTLFAAEDSTNQP